ncbi:hypothetical protein DES53_10291 [Roseimicrobium gellanilyticum]|uniref:Uncharacterized protein n=1 Tax=Roseimicrobium gellanilyticum TaxID=748857 RepID=A0A366HR43_9BACT|nr:hypothetical protein [Roseimicrobium gellanilyticum]RBP45709.1 hypothetical protein DES53_10291 [Roseimicrobium gellanilyticum]
MTEFQKACRAATKAGVEAAEGTSDEEVRAQVQRIKRLRSTGSAEISVPEESSSVDGARLVREAFESWNAERIAYEEKHGKVMPLPKVS